MFKAIQLENIIRKKTIVLFLLVIPVFALQAQSDSASAKPKHKTFRKPYDSIYKQQDFTDILFKVVHIKAKPDTAKLQPGKLYMAVFPAVGYTIVNGGTATVAANASFYTSDPDSTNLSTILTYPLYSSFHQIIVPVISSIWTKKNDINFLGDWRYYRYPSYTYGLGGNSSRTNAQQLNYSYVKVSQEALKHLSTNLYGGIGYALDYHFFIQQIGPAVNDYTQYNDNATKTLSSGLVAHLKYDSRTNINNPKDALFASLSYRYNSSILGSDNNWQLIQVEIRKYIHIASNPNNVFAFWSWNEFTYRGKVPYLDLPSTAWDTYANTGRGYIQGRFRGTSLMYLEAEYRFGITHNGLLGGVLFVNGQAIPDYPGYYISTINPGYGLGLRIKLNRYSDTNLCIDYGFGTGGSRGIFFNLGEVF